MTQPPPKSTLSLHDALPICHTGPARRRKKAVPFLWRAFPGRSVARVRPEESTRSEEHTSELQSRQYLVCRLLLEKKNKEIASEHQLILRSKQQARVTGSSST